MMTPTKALALSIPFACLMSLTMPVTAAPFAIEGPILSITPSADLAKVLVSCTGKKVVVDATTALKTPVGKISLAELANVPARPDFPSAGFSPVTRLPREGFVGGTCMVNADTAVMVSFSDSVAYPLAKSLMVEVAENVIVGPGNFTRDPIDPAKPGIGSQILGVPVSIIDDSRLPTARYAAGMSVLGVNGTSRPPSAAEAAPEYVRNAFGFGVEPSTVPVGDVLTAGGHLGSDLTLYAHTLESTDGRMMITQSRTSIQRAQCLALPGAVTNTFLSSYTIRGGCVLPAAATQALVRLIAVNPGSENVEIGTSTCTRKVAAGGLNPRAAMGLFTFAGRNIIGACPSSIAATLAHVPKLVTPANPRNNPAPVWADIVTPDLR